MRIKLNWTELILVNSYKYSHLSQFLKQTSLGSARQCQRRACLIALYQLNNAQEPNPNVPRGWPYTLFQNCLPMQSDLQNNALYYRIIRDVISSFQLSSLKNLSNYQFLREGQTLVDTTQTLKSQKCQGKRQIIRLTVSKNRQTF